MQTNLCILGVVIWECTYDIVCTCAYFWKRKGKFFFLTRCCLRCLPSSQLPWISIVSYYIQSIYICIWIFAVSVSDYVMKKIVISGFTDISRKGWCDITFWSLYWEYLMVHITQNQFSALKYMILYYLLFSNPIYTLLYYDKAYS